MRQATPSQLECLVSFLQQHMPPRALQFFDAQVESGEFVRSTKSLGLDRYRLTILRYSAELSWVGMAYRVYPPVMVCAHVMAWVEEHRNTLLELPPPQLDPDFDHERAADLIITLDLADEIVICRDPEGEVFFRGERWSPENPALYTAESFEINVSPEGGERG